MNQLQTILRRASRSKNEPLNVLTFPTHERTESSLAKTGHNFYAWRGEGIKDWNTKFASVPPNYLLLDHRLGGSQMLPWVDMDVILSQNKFGQFPIAMSIAQQLGVPLISMEHTLPPPKSTEGYISQMRSMQGDIDVFVTDFNRKTWGYPDSHGEIIHSGIDTDLFCPNYKERNGMVLTVANDFINRDELLGFSLWSDTVGYPQNIRLPATVVGDTKGFSLPANNTKILVNNYRSCSVYLNTTLWSSLPTVILEAMACECPVVSTGTTVIPSLMIQHGHNGFVSKNNDPEELFFYCNKLLNDKELRNKMGKNARQFIIDNFSDQKFIDQWNDIFDKTRRMHR